VFTTRTTMQLAIISFLIFLIYYRHGYRSTGHAEVCSRTGLSVSSRTSWLTQHPIRTTCTAFEIFLQAQSCASRSDGNVCRDEIQSVRCKHTSSTYLLNMMPTPTVRHRRICPHVTSSWMLLTLLTSHQCLKAVTRWRTISAARHPRIGEVLVIARRSTHRS